MMKYLLALCLLFSVAQAQSLPEQYAALPLEVRQNYDRLAAQLKPTLKPLEASVRALANNDRESASARLQTLNGVESQLETWIGASVLKYTLMLPLRSTIRAQMEVLAKSVPLKIPYKSHQIKAQFNISGAQLYPYGTTHLPLVRGLIEQGDFKKDDQVIMYFKQGGPVITTIKEDVTNPGDRESAFLLESEIDIDRFMGGAAFFIPQS